MLCEQGEGPDVRADVEHARGCIEGHAGPVLTAQNLLDVVAHRCGAYERPAHAATVS